MRYMIILLVLILAGCENGITGDVVKEIDINEWESLISQCPVCEECVECETCPECKDCPDCPKCERCERCEECEKCERCEDCEEYNSEAKIDIENLRIIKQTELADTETLEFTLTKEQYQQLSKAELLFIPYCGEDQDLTVSMNNQEIYDREPKCREINSMDIKSSRLKEGDNKLEFSSEYAMRIRDIELTMYFRDDTFLGKGFADIRIEEPDTENDLVEDFDDIEIRNYITKEFELNKVEDMIIRFDTSDVEGKLTVRLNNRIIYDKIPPEAKIRINLDADDLKRGTNTLTLIGVN